MPPELPARIISELGPWLCLVFGFALMTVEIMSGRAIALSFAVAALGVGTFQVLGASGLGPEISNLLAGSLFIASGCLILAALNLLKRGFSRN